MYKVGYIDDEPIQYGNFARKLKRSDIELILFENCHTKKDFVEKVFEKQAEVLLIDYKMAKSYGFDGTTLISYINDHVRDLDCFILTAVDIKYIDDGLVAGRNRFEKNIFDTEADNPVKSEKYNNFVSMIKESAEVFHKRRELKLNRYKELLTLRKQNRLGADEDEFLELYKVLSSYGMVEKLPSNMMNSQFEEQMNKLISIGESIIKDHSEK